MARIIDAYERGELEKLRAVIKAGNLNSNANDSIRIETTGHDPHCSVTIPAYVLEKFIMPLPSD